MNNLNFEKMTKENRKEKIKRFAMEAADMNYQIDFLEGKLHYLAEELKKLKLTKKEIEENDLQDTLDNYGI